MKNEVSHLEIGLMTFYTSSPGPQPKERHEKNSLIRQKLTILPRLVEVALRLLPVHIDVEVVFDLR